MKKTGFNSKRPRTERSRFERNEEWLAIAERDEWTCQHCGANVQSRQPQIAHRIASTLNNIARFGLEVIEHPKNKALTCSLVCNSHVSVGFNTMAALDLAAEIREDLEKGEVSV